MRVLRRLAGQCLLFGLLAGCAPAYAQAVSQAEVDAMRAALMLRMEEKGFAVPGDFPPACYDPLLDANARYARDTIWLGQVQAAFSTRDDRISLLYHEYIHWQNERAGCYPVGMDSLGNILQWDTGERYVHVPDSEEVQRDLLHFAQQVLPGYGKMDEAERAAHLQRYRRDMEQPRQLPFFYAPSHLAEEEIAAYQAQLDGESLGLYLLSASARREIRIRIRQLEATRARRRDYEQRQGLGPDGR